MTLGDFESSLFKLNKGLMTGKYGRPRGFAAALVSVAAASSGGAMQLCVKCSVGSSDVRDIYAGLEFEFVEYVRLQFGIRFFYKCFHASWFFFFFGYSRQES
jgi:hypothetical protein